MIAGSYSRNGNHGNQHHGKQGFASMPKSKVRKIAAMGGKAHAKGLHDDDEEEDDESYRKGTPIPLLRNKKSEKKYKQFKKKYSNISRINFLYRKKI